MQCEGQTCATPANFSGDVNTGRPSSVSSHLRLRNKAAGNRAENITPHGFSVSHWHNTQIQRVWKRGQKFSAARHFASYEITYSTTPTPGFSAPCIKIWVLQLILTWKRYFRRENTAWLLGVSQKTSTGCQTAPHLHLYGGGQLGVIKDRGGLLRAVMQKFRTVS